MNENDVIAEYVKEKYPELLNTFEFAIFRLVKAWENIKNNLAKIVTKSQDEHEIQEGEENGES